jgi:hypothetical protein
MLYALMWPVARRASFSVRLRAGLIVPPVALPGLVCRTLVSVAVLCVLYRIEGVTDTGGGVAGDTRRAYFGGRPEPCHLDAPGACAALPRLAL